MKIIVQKKDLAGQVRYVYEGQTLKRNEHTLVLEALFDRADMPFMDTVFRTGDRFVEYYYSDRWYNIFEIHDRDDDRVKGWYCNVSQPAELGDDMVSYVDLALDLWVSADGKQTVLDEDEFDELKLDDELKAGALRGLDELKQIFLNNKPPV